jgi:hypothetical protein
MTEPKRLLEGSDTPKALRDALQALEAEGPSAAAHARISARITAGRTAGNTASPSSKPARMKWLPALLGLASLGAAVISWQAWTSGPVQVERAPATHTLRAPRVERAPGEETSRPAAGRPAARAAVATPAPIAAAAATAASATPAATAASETSIPAPAARVRPARSPARASAMTPVRAPLASTRSAEVAIEPIAPSEAPAANEAPAASEALRPTPSVVEAAERQFADPQDEASLLYRARRLASSDPNGALRLLVLHEASFPSGSFGEERDMLEIQVHERLGHRALAQRLAAQFRARYPGSVYGAGDR